MQLRDSLRQRGRELARAGLCPAEIALDLDETVWDWVWPLLGAPLDPTRHREVIFLREPLVWLLEGISAGHPGSFVAWTSGYGYRLDRIAEQYPPMRALFGIDAARAHAADDLPTVFGRRDFLRAVQRAPASLPPGTGLSQKVPGMPTAAGKPLVDAARILLDDRESNCRRFAAAGGGRSAIWLRGTPRVWRQNITMFGTEAPRRGQWAEGIADALAQIAAGDRGRVHPVDPAADAPAPSRVELRIPHRRVWTDWIAPGRTTRRLIAQLDRAR